MSKSSAKLSLQTQSVLITGGTGLVGSLLSDLLESDGYCVSHLSRNSTKGKYPSFHWDINKNHIDPKALEGIDAIIHLAGAGVAEKRWSKHWKKTIYDSRIQSTRLLMEKLKTEDHQVKHFISASAIGIYGWDTGDLLVNEDHPKGEGFLADVVADWEAEADKLNSLEIKLAKVRIGVVLSNKGAALVEMLKPIRLGLGAPLASGKQFMSWIHEEDLGRIFIHILENRSIGNFNGVSPNPISNSTFTTKLAQQVKKPLWLPNVPASLLKLMLGEMSGILIGGNRVSSEKIENTGFVFHYPTIDDSLKQLLH